MSAAFEAAGLGVALGGRMVVRDLDLAVAPGRWFGLLGVNGSGKTTLLRCLAGRLPAAAGRVLVGGADLTRDEAGRSARFGFASPPDALPGELTAADLIGLVAALHGADPTAPADLYQALGIADLGRRRIGQMSSGMRQRVAIFLAFLGSPRIVLLDEPFNWLDPVAAVEVKAALRAMVGEGLTLVTALHDVATFATRCDEGLVLHEGRVLRRFASEALAAGRRDLQALEDEVYRAFRADGA
jgi:ABC-2 type transport system ATP-binding protein